MVYRIGGIYLWAALILASFLMDVRDAAGVGAVLVAGTIHLALLVAAVWISGAKKTEAGLARERASFLPGVLLLAGPIVLFWGASTGEPTASQPGAFLFNATGLLLGALFALGAFAVLAARLRKAGEDIFSTLGLAGISIGVALFCANVAFRFAAMASGAAGEYARLEDAAALPNYLAGMPDDPSPLLVMMAAADVILAAYVLVSYLSVVAFSVALVRVGWFGRWGGAVFATLGLTFAGAVVVGILSDSQFGAGLAFFLTIPFMSTVLPYFLGVALIRRGGGRQAVATRSFFGKTPT